ncbi:hypothetical protein BKA66DRAFT_444301 [Pyrenochaeta sp. MPI-SDFR-AT-0127]|nr:hypothetical protein BKA66DRAFT_444301 [Pyrenochaeta sp. MPI-SDFR-AT-0127]
MLMVVLTTVYWELQSVSAMGQNVAVMASSKLYFSIDRVAEFRSRSSSIGRAPILHMTDSDWAKCLNTRYAPTTVFDDALDACRQQLDLAPIKCSIQSCEETKLDAQISHLGSFFSPGDHRVWHTKARIWTQQLMDDVSESYGRESSICSSASSQTELVEALIGHGLLRDDDLTLLVAEKGRAGITNLPSIFNSTDLIDFYGMNGVPASVVSEKAAEDKDKIQRRVALSDVINVNYFCMTRPSAKSHKRPRRRRPKRRA